MIGVCASCERPLMEPDEWFALLSLAATVDTVYQEERPLMYRNLASARAAMGRIERDLRAWRKASGA
jgi:hypothetical protein